jgi:hypothetical protein
MHRLTICLLVSLAAPVALVAQQRPAAPHDSVRGAVRTVDVQARTLEVTSGVGYAIRVVKLQVPPDVPITDREHGRDGSIRFAELKPGDVVRAVFGGRQAGLVAYVIERVGRMDQGVERMR